VKAELPRTSERDRDDTVLERVRWIGGVVLDPELVQAELLGQLIGAQERGPSCGQRRLGRRGYREKIAIAPDRMWPGLYPPAKLLRIGSRS
jgi:hypothetical protein